MAGALNPANFMFILLQEVATIKALAWLRRSKKTIFCRTRHLVANFCFNLILISSPYSERDYDGQRGSSRNSPPTPVTPPSKFPASDSTTDYTKAASSSTFKSDRIRPRSSDSAGAIVSGGPGIDSAEAAAEARAKFQLHEYRRGEPPDQPGRPRSPRSPATRSSGM